MKNGFLTFLFIFFIFFSCKQKQVEKIPETNNPIQYTKVEYGKKFFDFDEVDYYSTQITEDDAMKLLDNQTSKIDEQKYNVIMNDEYPKSLNEMEFIKNLNKIGFKKTKIETEKFSDLNQIFVEKSEQDGIVFSCIPVFRDLLVFKKKNKITGFAKICFDCNFFHIIGTNADLKNFGQGDDYEKLGKILDSK